MTKQAIPLSMLKETAEREGWDVIDDLLDNPGGATPKAAEMSDAERAWAEATARVLATPDGELMMEGLLDRTLRRASWAYQLGMDPLQIAMLGVRREGQNSIPHMMLQAAARGREQQPEPPRD